MDGMELFKKLAQCEDKEQMQRCIEEHRERQKPQTNADRIRAMSDEELVHALRLPLMCPEEEFKYCKPDINCTECWLEWLKQPAEGE